MTATASTRGGGGDGGLDRDRRGDPATGPGFFRSRIALTAVLVALSVALGLLLVGVPNVELLTFTIFVSGAVLGRWRGAAVGALAMGIFSGVNPYGSGLGFPPLFVAQVIAAALTGLVGGATTRLWDANGPGQGRFPLGVARTATAGAIGFALAAIYQGVVILGIAIASPEFRTGVFAAIVSNAFFSIVHVVSNTIIFAVLAPVVIPRAKRLVAQGGAR